PRAGADGARRRAARPRRAAPEPRRRDLRAAAPRRGAPLRRVARGTPPHGLILRRPAASAVSLGRAGSSAVCSMFEPRARRRRARPGTWTGPGPGTGPRRPTQLLAEPLVDLRLVGGDPLLRRLIGVHVVPGDHLGDGVLIRVRPAEPLDDADGRRAARRELLAHELQQRVARVLARVLLRVAAELLVVQAA